MDTEKLYDQDAFLREFDAVVTGCYEGKDGSCLVTLDRTAFYPEGGGQPADHGVLGGAAVLDVQEREGRVLHTCDRPLPVGRTVRGVIDWGRRFDHMQQHSGEHIVSGMLCAAFSCDNVGFHMGADTVIIDYNAPMTWEQVLEAEERTYRKILVCRPNAQFDTDIGFLPGDEQEKISPLMRPIMDNLEQLLDKDDTARYDDELELESVLAEVFDRNLIQMKALNFIRGRSLEKIYLIIDEAQNMTPNQVKGIITRAGKGTKVILLGDPQQIDKPFLDERTNGLSYASEKMKGSPLCCQVTMLESECERSRLALEAIGRL